MNSELWYQLPPDMQTWNTAVVENISRKIPEIPNYISAITWSKLDPATGDGDGLVEFLGGMGAAPIIIRGNKLAPVDTIATNAAGGTKFYPLSPMFLQKIYADNVIGEPVMNQTDRDESYEGPGKRIQHIKTVDGVKYASKECAQYLLDEITKSASVANWMADRMPETLVAIYNRANEVEKVANVGMEDLPELVVAWRDKDAFFINDERVDAQTISDFCKVANATDEERSGLMSGVPIVRDRREKVAAIAIPSEQEVTALKLSDAEAFEYPDIARAKSANPRIALTTAYMKDGTTKYGIVFSNDAFSNQDRVESKAVPNIAAAPQEGSLDKYTYNEPTYNHRELFISKDGYGFNGNIKTNTRVELSTNLLYNMSEPTTPAVGLVGIFMSSTSCLSDFGRIEEVVHLGRYILIHMYSYLSHTINTHRLQDDAAFFEVVDKQLEPAYIEEKVDTVSMTGINGVVRRDNEGNVIIEGITHSAVNCPYALMNKYAAAYEDAVTIRDIALEYGKCEFEVFEPIAKTAAENDNADKTKSDKKSDSKSGKDTKGTKSGTDDESGDMSPIAPQLSGMSPESMMSVDLENDPNMGFGVGQPYSSPAGPAPEGYGGVPAGAAAGGPAVVGAPAGYSAPVSSKDMENIVQINSPQVMDAYLMSNVASDNLANRETIMRTSDSVLRALEHLSQLLFLIRQGNMDFVSENDVQVAIAKLADVAQSLGISNSQVGA